MGEVVRLYGEEGLSKEAITLFDHLFEETDVFRQLGLSAQQILLFQRLCWRLYDGQTLNANAQEIIEIGFWHGVKKSTASDVLTLLVDLELLIGPVVNRRTKARKISINTSTLRKLRQQESRAETVEKLLSKAAKARADRRENTPSKFKNHRRKNTTKEQSGGNGRALKASAIPVGADASLLPTASLSSNHQDTEELSKVFTIWPSLDQAKFIEFLDDNFDQELNYADLSNLAMVFDRYDDAVPEVLERIKSQLFGLSSGGGVQ